MKFLIHSNSPATKTGYGVQTALLAERLHDLGHQVAISATWGQQGFSGTWKPDRPRNPELWEKGIRVYQVGWHLNGVDIVHNHAMHWFDGDPLAGWVIVHGDVWSLKDNVALRDFNVAAWAPVDHFPCPPGVTKFIADTEAIPIAMSQFGEYAFQAAGLDPVYIPLAVDTQVYKPTLTIDHDIHGTHTGRALMGVPEEAFLVGMVAMNKDPDDRKGFNEAFAAFSSLRRNHGDAILYVHSDPHGMGSSFSLEELAAAHGIPQEAIVFPAVYGYQMGWTSEMMAAVYTGFDVLLAPSKGEGFCVPIIEAQACGTPVIVSDFSAQPELVAEGGWKIPGQQLYDPAHHAFYMTPRIDKIVEALEEAYVADLDDLAEKAIAKAALYDADRVFEWQWMPLLEQMTADPVRPELDREGPFEVAVLVPAMRVDNIERIIRSFDATNDGSASLAFVCDEGFPAFGGMYDHRIVWTGKTLTSYAEKINAGFAASGEPWVFCCGDDIEFHPGWLNEAGKHAEQFDLIGTNDSLPGRVRNPDVASGAHADHFFVRRSYVETYGACLEGPGVLAPECYGHWFVDAEIVGLAKARGVFTPCLSSIVEHHHPGYDGREDLRFSDPTYSRAVELSDDDQRTFQTRRHLIEMQRTYRGRR